MTSGFGNNGRFIDGFTDGDVSKGSFIFQEGWAGYSALFTQSFVFLPLCFLLRSGQGSTDSYNRHSVSVFEFLIRGKRVFLR